MTPSENSLAAAHARLNALADRLEGADVRQHSGNRGLCITRYTSNEERAADVQALDLKICGAAAVIAAGRPVTADRRLREMLAAGLLTKPRRALGRLFVLAADGLFSVPESIAEGADGGAIFHSKTEVKLWDSRSMELHSRRRA